MTITGAHLLSSLAVSPYRSRFWRSLLRSKLIVMGDAMAVPTRAEANRENFMITQD